MPPKAPESVDTSKPSARPPFTTSMSRSTTPPSHKIRRSGGNVSTCRRTEPSANAESRRRNRQSHRRSQGSFLEKAREEGRSTGELELIETIEREIVQGKVDVSWDSIGISRPFPLDSYIDRWPETSQRFTSRGCRSSSTPPRLLPRDTTSMEGSSNVWTSWHW